MVNIAESKDKPYENPALIKLVASIRDALQPVVNACNEYLQTVASSMEPHALQSQPSTHAATSTPETLDPVTLDKLPWKDGKKSGSWIFADVNDTAKALALLIEKQKQIEIGDYSYRLSKGDSKSFIWRYSKRQGK